MNNTSSSSPCNLPSQTFPRRIVNFGGELTDDDLLFPLSLPSINGGASNLVGVTARTTSPSRQLSPQERHHQLVISILDQALLVVFDDL